MPEDECIHLETTCPMNEHTRFTFCIPNRNKIQYLPACIESMLAQDCGDWCCVFVDGFSDDGCWEYMQQFADDPRFVLKQGLGKGMYADWNYCLEMVTTEYFYILTSDDTCYPGLVSKAVNALDQFSDIDVCHFKFELINEKGVAFRSSPEIAKLQFPLYAPFYDHAHIRNGIIDFLMHYAYGALYTTITSLVFRTCILKNVKGFSVEHGSTGDYDLTMRLGLYSDILYLPECLATWRKYEGQADAQIDELSRRQYGLEIGKKNIKILMKKDFIENATISSLDSNKILADLKDAYTSAAYYYLWKNKSGRLSQNLRLLVKTMRRDPSYGLRKILRRLSSNRLFTYDPNELLYEVFQDLDLEWEPRDVEVASRVSDLVTPI